MTEPANGKRLDNPLKRGERLPKKIPQWLKRRIETDIYQLYDFGEEAGQATAPGSRVLDAGAGEGRYKPDFDHTEYVGVDLAVGDVAWNYQGLDTICNLTDLPFPDDTFDVALCMQVLEHVPEPQRVLNGNGDAQQAPVVAALIHAVGLVDTGLVVRLALYYRLDRKLQPEWSRLAVAEALGLDGIRNSATEKPLALDAVSRPRSPVELG